LPKFNNQYNYAKHEAPLSLYFGSANFYWGWSCSNFKVSNYFWNNLVCSSQQFNRLTVGDSQIVVGYWFFTFYNACSKAHVICKAIASLIGLVYRNNMKWDALHSPNAKHCLIHLLGINLKKWNFAPSFLTLTRHFTSNLFD
jgi:hypothetical protein